MPTAPSAMGRLPDHYKARIRVSVVSPRLHHSKGNRYSRPGLGGEPLPRHPANRRNPIEAGRLKGKMDRNSDPTTRNPPRVLRLRNHHTAVSYTHLRAHETGRNL